MAGMLAAAGYHVLAIDMDPQGNLGRDLGYLATGQSDHGRSLFGAVTGGTSLRPLCEVRPGLDVIAGGEMVDDMTGALYARGVRGESVAGAVRDAVASLASDYDIVFIDCPPGNRPLQKMALTAAHWVVIPTRADEASLDGLAKVAELFTSIRSEDNPGLELLGVVLFGVGSQSRRISQRARTAISDDLGDSTLLFKSEIRHVEGPAQDCRRLGRLVHEIEADLGAAKAARLAWLRARRGDGAGKHRPDPDAVSQLAASAPGLAGDYQRLAEELVTRIADRQQVPA
jgi:cellulose biosynthesis protein BcsQ